MPVTIREKRRIRRRRRVAVGTGIALIGVVVADGLLGLGYHPSTTVRVVVTPAASGSVDEALVVFPGYASDGTVISRAFAPHLNENQAMIVVDYAQRGVDDAAIYQAVVAELNALAPQHVRILGGSMGGIVASRFLYHYAGSSAHARFGDVVLVLDTAPGGARYTHRPQWMFDLAAWYRGGPLSSAMWAIVSRFGQRPPLEYGADQSVVDEGEDRGAWVGLPAVTSQAAYIATFNSSELPPIRRAISRATYLRADSAEQDPLVVVSQSIEEWQRGLSALTVTTVASREGGWHLPWIYRPRETLTAVNAA